MATAHLAGGGKACVYAGDVPGCPLPWVHRGLCWLGRGAGPSAAFPWFSGWMAGSLGNASLYFLSHSGSERWGKQNFTSPSNYSGFYPSKLKTEPINNQELCLNSCISAYF